MSGAAGGPEVAAGPAGGDGVGEGLRLDMAVVLRPVSELRPYERNARTHTPEQIERVAASIREFGWTNPVLINDADMIVAGHARVQAALLMGLSEVPTISLAGLSDTQIRAYVLADNRLSELAGWDDVLLAEELERLRDEGFDVGLAGFDEEVPVGGGDEEEVVTLQDRFLVPPFSVLDARKGYWQDRKREWLDLGIESEVGRGDKLTYGASVQGVEAYRAKEQAEKAAGRSLSWEEYYQLHPEAYRLPGTSIFDPVLCELAYRWFCPAGGAVLDPFAGGSVRGIVASRLGLEYFGVELRGEQVAANRAQAERLCRGVERVLVPRPDSTPELTPVERLGGVWLKRDDAFSVGGGCGGKVRTCLRLARGASGLVTAGSRSSPQVNIVAQIARVLGVPCRVHLPEGELSGEAEMARAAGAEVVQHPAGYNSVIIARAREDAKARGWREIPFGMECREAVEATAKQVANLPDGVARIVVPVGSGMSLAGVLTGLRRRGLSIPVLGVVVGADPVKRLDKYAPKGWREMVDLVPAGMEYDERPPETRFEGVQLDPIYEAKCIRFLREGDLLWVVGLRASVAAAAAERPLEYPMPEWVEGDSLELERHRAGREFDFLFSCPPYADLEVYSEDARDLSNMDYDRFLVAYREIIRLAVAALRPNRFAFWVVGDVRDKSGRLRAFPGDTVRAFEDAGCSLYNDGVLVTAVGSLPTRIVRQFTAGRKLGRSHQNVQIFYKGAVEHLKDGMQLVPHHESVMLFLKGDPKKARAALSDIEVSAIEPLDLEREGAEG